MSLACTCGGNTSILVMLMNRQRLAASCRLTAHHGRVPSSFVPEAHHRILLKHLKRGNQMTRHTCKIDTLNPHLQSSPGLQLSHTCCLSNTLQLQMPQMAPVTQLSSARAPMITEIHTK